MPTILPYSRDSMSVAMPVVCSCQPVAATDACNTCNQREEPSAYPSEVRNEKEFTKSASIMDPAVLMSPTSHHHPTNTTTGTTSTRTSYFSSRCHRWEMSRRREPGDAIIYHADGTARTQTQVVAHCTVRRAHAAVIWLRDSISRARSCTRRPALKSRREGTK